MAVGRSLLLLTLALAIPTARVTAQVSPQRAALERGMELEGKSQFRQAAAEYRTALSDTGSYPMALLGLERALHESGAIDTLLVVIDSIVRIKNAEPLVRTVQFRALAALGRDAQMRAAFEAWRTAAPRDIAPYREYARTLIDAGRMQLADSVLNDAGRSTMDTRVLSLELAQVRSALGMWDEAIDAWRKAVEDADYLERAAYVGLSRAPVEKRDKVRERLLQPPVVIAVRKVLSSLEINWGSPLNAWQALRELPPTDSARTAWLEFAEQAEAGAAWLPARDALLAALGRGGRDGDTEIAARAARAAVSGGDSEGALALVTRQIGNMQQRDAVRWFGTVHVRALASLGKPGEAESIATDYLRLADENVRQQLRNEVAWGWVRAGELERARRALSAGVNEREVGEINGWIALYSGDLRTARTQLRGYGDASRFPGTLLAMSILGRARIDSSTRIGEAFLALARGDSTRSAQAFQAAAGEIPEAASLLLSTAARMFLVKDTTASIGLWKAIVERYPESPEAADSELEWARVLRRRGDKAGAIERLEHLIITHPASALLPQARRELDAIRGTNAGG